MQEAEQSIFDEEELTRLSYDKHVRNARNAIFVVAGVQFVFGTIAILTRHQDLDSSSFMISIGLIVITSLVFLALGLWTKKKPYTAILIALIFYALLLLTDAIYEPSTIFKGAIMKIFIIVYLVRGLNQAKEAQQLKEALGK
ncbi:MAG TPA: hypothetical protein VKT28_16755 [Puia sp.]|nr:hypothetical protein [Puia sp.]